MFLFSVARGVPIAELVGGEIWPSSYGVGTLSLDSEAAKGIGVARSGNRKSWLSTAEAISSRVKATLAFCSEAAMSVASRPHN